MRSRDQMMRNRKVGYLALMLICMLLIFGCGSAETDSSGTEAEEETETETGESGVEEEHSTIYEDDTVYSEEQLSVQEAFDSYLSQLFIDELSESTVSLHFKLEDPEAYGIERYEATWGDLDFLSYAEGYDEAAEEEIVELTSYDYDSLNYEQRLTYDILLTYLEDQQVLSEYDLFDEVFSPLQGIQAQLPLVFTEYDFLEQQDIEDCLSLLEQVGDYVDACLTYETARAEQGYFLTDTSVEEVVEQCREFIDAEENCVLAVLSDNIDSFEGIDEETRAAYQLRLETAVTEVLIPAYERIIETLESLAGSRSAEGGLANFEGGTEYYTALLRCNTGTDKTPEELIELTEEKMAADIEEMMELLIDDSSLWEASDEYEFLYTDPEDILSYLSENLGSDFAAPVSTNYTVKTVHEAMESMCSPAFYMVPPIDNADENVIYYNQSSEYEDMDLFTTLVHEGYPGHLYQESYFVSLGLSSIRYLLSFDGYTEGWATYVEIEYGYALGLEDEDLARLLALNASYAQGIYTRVDLGIHYEGWSLEETEEYLYDLGYTDPATAEALYETLIDDPAVYPAYYIGYLEILELRDTAEELLGEEYTAKAFHQFLMEIGPAQFEIIEERMLEWIEEELAEAA